VNRTVLLVAALTASIALLVSTGAVPLDGGTDEIEGVDVEMAPADAPNGKYAMMNEEDEIELVLSDENPDLDGEGVLENAVTPIDRVFTITNTGIESARVWISDDAADVRFYRGGDPDDSLEGAANEVTVAPNETIAVGLLVDTRGDHDVEDVSGFTVHVEQATPTPPLTTVQPTATPEQTPETTTTSTTTTPPETTAPTSTSTSGPGAPTTTSSLRDQTTATAAPDSDNPGSVQTTTGGNSSPTVTTESPRTDDGDGALAEIGGFGATGALGLLALLLVVLAALRAYRRYQGS